MNLWDRWSRLTEVVAGKRPGTGDRDGWTRSFIGAMNVIAAPQADGLVAAVEPGPARRLLDVGGGPATYTLAFVKAVPGLRATLFDLPAVIDLARENVAAAGLLERVDLVAGDLRSDALPGGHDLAFVSAIVHMLGPSGNTALFRKVHDALVPGGRIVIRDHVMSPDRTAPRAGALFAVNMLVGTQEGGHVHVRGDRRVARRGRVRQAAPDARGGADGRPRGGISPLSSADPHEPDVRPSPFADDVQNRSVGSGGEYGVLVDFPEVFGGLLEASIRRRHV